MSLYTHICESKSVLFVGLILKYQHGTIHLKVQISNLYWLVQLMIRHPVLRKVTNRQR